MRSRSEVGHLAVPQQRGQGGRGRGRGGGGEACVSAVKRSIGSTTGCIITEKAPTRVFSWLKVPTRLALLYLRHYLDTES